MINPTTYYEVICDHCGERLMLDDMTAWETEEEARATFNYCGWQEMQDGKIFCDNCLDREYLFNEDKQ